MLTRVLLTCACLVAFAGCRLEGASGNAGLECTTSDDCNDDKLGCVPIDDKNPGGQRVCMPPSLDWSCPEKFFGDASCDCGCGFLDIDCNGDKTSASCNQDTGNNCPAGKNPVVDDNTKCQ